MIENVPRDLSPKEIFDLKQEVNGNGNFLLKMASRPPK